jgi:hypothetical protein
LSKETAQRGLRAASGDSGIAQTQSGRPKAICAD